MKRVFILCLMILVFCVGCKEGASPVSDQPDDQDEAVAGNPKLLEPAPEVAIANPIEELLLKVPTELVQVIYSNGVPIAFFENGMNLIKPSIDNYWSFQLDEIEAYVENWLKNETFYIYQINQAQSLDQVDFHQVTSPSLAREQPEDYDFAVNSDQEFMADVTHVQYSFTQQYLFEEKYLNYFAQLLQQEGIGNTPVVITDIWRYDLDQDGQEEVWVKACNSIYSTTDQQPIKNTLAHQDAIGNYIILTMFSVSLDEKILTKKILPFDFLEDTAHYNLSLKTEDMDYAGSSYLKQQDGQITAVPIYNKGEHFYPSQYVANIIICDLNGDGLYDLCHEEGGNGIICDIYVQNIAGQLELLYGCIIM